MKKVFLLIVLSISVFASNLSREHQELSGRLVEVLGYECNKVDLAVRSYFDGSIKVFCDDYSNAYVVKKVGGHWTIKVK